LYDLGSMSGTSLNGKSVVQAALGSGDTIRVGDTDILFQGLCFHQYTDVISKEKIKRVNYLINTKVITDKHTPNVYQVAAYWR
jgi:pSer/pThr/pTyr-binding forkhead associated (FHA) protein